MTFEDLQKLVQSQSAQEQSQLLQRLRDKPFWVWDQKQHRQEDIDRLGLPINDNVEKRLYNYEKLLYDSLLIPDSTAP